MDKEYSEIQSQASFKKSVYGVFGYIKLSKVSHLILIEEASIVGQLMRGTVYKVEKLMFVPLNYNAKMQIDAEDLPFVDMIKTV